MVSSEGSKEVPDSEDEPMTSSPVDVSDGAADKLCAPARAPLQDTEGAPKEAIRHLQARADGDANVPGRRINSLDADRIDASVDVDSSEHGATNLQPDNSTPLQGFPREVGNSSCVPHPDSALHSKPAPDVTPTEQEFIPPKVVANNQADADCEMTSVPDAEITTSTDNTMLDPDPTSPGHQGEATLEHSQSSPLGVHRPKLGSSASGQQVALREAFSDDCVKEQYGSAIASCGNPHETVGSQDESKGLGAQQESTSSSIDAAFDDISNAVAQGPDSQTHCGASDERKDAENTVCVLRQDVDRRTHVTDGSTSTDDQSSVEINSESISFATNTAPTPINRESQSTMKNDASTPNVAIDIVSSASSPTTNTAHAMGEPPVSTANDTAPSDSKPEAVPTLESPVKASGVDLNTPSSTSPQASTTADVPVVAKTPQEITLAELKAQKAAILASLAVLPAIQILMEEAATSNVGMSGDEDEPTEDDVMVAANKIVKDHIKLLHEYNELKDVGQGLMGLIADQRGVRIVEVQEEFGIEAND